MIWKIELRDTAIRDLGRLDRPVRQRILRYLNDLASLSNPRLRGKALTGNRAGEWRYRVGDYRVLCVIHEDVLTISVINAGHRSKVYE